MCTQNYIKAVKALYTRADNRYRKVLRAIAGQWALESGWGKSKLAESHSNFGGMKYRRELSDLCDAVLYTDWEGKEDLYCALADPEDYCELYFRFINRPRYKGINGKLGSDKEFLEHLYDRGYVGSMPGGKENYVSTILSIIDRLPEELRDPVAVKRQHNIENSDYPAWLLGTR